MSEGDVAVCVLGARGERDTIGTHPALQDIGFEGGLHLHSKLALSQ